MNPTCKDCGKEMKCSDCRYWVGEKGKLDGECREGPPQILLVPMDTKIGLTPGLAINGFFPRMRPDLWCGKFMRLTVAGKSSKVTDIPRGETYPAKVWEAPDDGTS